MSKTLHTLSNGATVIIDQVPHVDTAAVGLYFTVGARYETEENNGVAHFLEHMAFKGTKTRSAQQIAIDMEDRGAEANAFTSYEQTCYFMHGLAKDAPVFIEILSDIIKNSTLPEDEIERERGAIIQEIGMNKDNPGRTAWQNASMTAFPGQPLGAAILGPRSNIETMDRKTLADFFNEHYHAGNLIVSIAGNVDPAIILQDLENALGAMPTKPKSGFKPATYQGGHHHEERPTQQLNLSMCFNSNAITDPATAANIVLGIILGDGMSSRLFQEIREKRGLVYGIGAGNSPNQDVGTFNIGAGTGPAEIAQLMPVLCEELKKLRTDLVSEEEMKRAASKVIASAALGDEAMDNRMIGAARDYHYHGRLRTDEERLQEIKAVTREQVRDAANRIFSSRPTISTVGPGQNVEPYAQIVQRLKL